jgi:hypothetical protein
LAAGGERCYIPLRRPGEGEEQAGEEVGLQRAELLMKLDLAKAKIEFAVLLRRAAGRPLLEKAP